MRLFARQRYFVRRGIVIYTENNLNQATDLDVVAVRWHPPFRKHLQIVECKSGKERPLDRIFWLNGVRDFTKADSAALVRNDTKWDIKAFARDCGVQLLDFTAIGALEERLQLTSEPWPALADADFFATHQVEWLRQINSDQHLLELHRFLEGEARWQRPVLSMRYLLLQMRRLVRVLRNEGDNLLIRTLLADCFGHFMMFSTSLASQTIEMRPDDARNMIYRDAKFGSADPRLVARLMKLARKVTEDALLEAGLNTNRINEQSFDFTEPQNVEDLIAIRAAVLADGGKTEDLAAFADYIVWETFVRGRGAAHWIDATYGGDAKSLTQAAKSISAIMERLEAVPEGFTRLFDVATMQLKIDALEDALDSGPFLSPLIEPASVGETPSPSPSPSPGRDHLDKSDNLRQDAFFGEARLTSIAADASSAPDVLPDLAEGCDE